jgi:hypothetical protein
MCAVQWGCGDTIRERKVSLVYRTHWNALLDVAFPPVGRLGLTSPPSLVLYDATTATMSLSGRFACRSLPDTLRASPVRGVPVGLVAWLKRPDRARAFDHPVPHSGSLVKETGGSPKFPSSPCADMPRSQTPVVSCALALAHPGLLPSSACKPSAFLFIHNYTHFGAQSRGLPARYPRLRTAPYGEARGFATDLLARL